MNDRPEHRGHDDHGPDVTGRAVPAAKQKATKERFIANRCHYDYSQEQPGQPARGARGAIGVKLKLGDDIAAEQPADPIRQNDEDATAIMPTTKGRDNRWGRHPATAPSAPVAGS